MLVITPYTCIKGVTEDFPQESYEKFESFKNWFLVAFRLNFYVIFMSENFNKFFCQLVISIICFFCKLWNSLTSFCDEIRFLGGQVEIFSPIKAFYWNFLIQSALVVFFLIKTSIALYFNYSDHLKATILFWFALHFTASLILKNMLSESKKKNPKPAAWEHRVISRLKAAEEASRRFKPKAKALFLK